MRSFVACDGKTYPVLLSQKDLATGTPGATRRMTSFAVQGRPDAGTWHFNAPSMAEFTVPNGAVVWQTASRRAIIGTEGKVVLLGTAEEAYHFVCEIAKLELDRLIMQEQFPGIMMELSAIESAVLADQEPCPGDSGS